MALDGFKKILKDEKKELAKDADDIIIKNFYINGISGDNKIFNGLLQYNSDSYMLKKIIPGSIYSFVYEPKYETSYNIDGQVFKYKDTLPLVLVTNSTPTILQGINLNLCTEDIRIFLLNLIWNIDPEYFESGARALVSFGKAPISPKVTSFFEPPFKAQSELLKQLKRMVSIDYSLIFRTYNPNNLKKLQYIEPWQWKYVPYVKYSNTLKASFLNDIHKATGLDKIKISL